MTRGKNICNQLKAVRRRIAEENGIPLEIEECTYTGECRGTCPRCEAEARYLEKALYQRHSAGFDIILPDIDPPKFPDDPVRLTGVIVTNDIVDSSSLPLLPPPDEIKIRL